MSRSKPYKVLLLDLFWTVVDIDFSRFPRVRCRLEGDEEEEIPTSGDLLYAEVARNFSKIVREDFLRAYLRNRGEVLKAWDRGVLEEVSSAEKFFRFLVDLKLEGQEEALRELAERMTKIHMSCIVASTILPERRKRAILNLAENHRLILVSNFDHAQTGREILRKHGISECFHRVVISDDLGRRKPAPEIFLQAVRGIEVAPKDILMVGDTPAADIEGARAHGFATAWIERPNMKWPEGLQPPDFRLRDLADLLEMPRIQRPRSR